MAYEDDPPEFTGATQMIKADPKGSKRAAAPAISTGNNLRLGTCLTYFA